MLLTKQIICQLNFSTRCANELSLLVEHTLSCLCWLQALCRGDRIQLQPQEAPLLRTFTSISTATKLETRSWLSLFFFLEKWKLVGWGGQFCSTFVHRCMGQPGEVPRALSAWKRWDRFGSQRPKCEFRIQEEEIRKQYACKKYGLTPTWSRNVTSNT